MRVRNFWKMPRQAAWTDNAHGSAASHDNWGYTQRMTEIQDTWEFPQPDFRW